MLYIGRGKDLLKLSVKRLRGKLITGFIQLREEKIVETTGFLNY